MMNRFTKMNKCPFNSKYLKLKVNVRTFHTSSASLKKLKSTGIIESLTYPFTHEPGTKKNVACELPPGYHPSYVERVWYDWWEKQRLFQPAQNTCDQATKTPFVMCLPPPNVTGTLHIGHALGCAIQDSLCRWSRMSGYDTLWVPGTDHAGISTQVVVEKMLWKEKQMSRHELGRDAFVKEVLQWKEQKGNMIYEQMKQLGCSLDWSRSRFTLDQSMSTAVTEAFVRLHDEGLIRRDKLMVNWCCTLRSNISDIEVENTHITENTKFKVPGYDNPVTLGKMYSFAYPVLNSDEELIITTTRPETMLGDTGVAVNVDDSRYKHLHGKSCLHPFTGDRIPIICDEHANMSKGTGVVKITPGHDFNDYEVGKRNELEIKTILDDAGHMCNVPEQFQGVARYVARDMVIESLKSKSLYRGVKHNHPMTVPMCNRTGDIVEPLLKSQWFLDCQQMAAHAKEVVETETLTIHPKHYKKTWYHHMDKCKEWCISRQLWWGHQIPVYKVIHKDTQCSVSGVEWVSGRSKREAMEKAVQKSGIPENMIELVQDEDVLDTWFSSALFPFAIFDWPKQTSDLLKFYPTQVLDTASDILYVWVSRMVMLGYHLTGKLPFHTVLFHRLVRDRYGRKMSKSLGNIIDPMDIIHGRTLEELEAKFSTTYSEITDNKSAYESYPDGIKQCGADALRYTLCSYGFRGEKAINLDDQVRDEESRSLRVVGFTADVSLSDLQQLMPDAVSIETKEKHSKIVSAIAMFLTIEDMEDNYNKLQGMQWNGDDIRVDYVAENSVLAGGWEGNSMNVDLSDIEESRHFCNKIWQAYRFCAVRWDENYQPLSNINDICAHPLSSTDLWMLSCITKLVTDCNKGFQMNALSKVTDAIHTFWKTQFCDNYLEYAKIQLQTNDHAQKQSVLHTLYLSMDVGLRCLAPMMPFLTEELAQRLPKSNVCDLDMYSVHKTEYPTIAQYDWRNDMLEDDVCCVQLMCQKVKAVKEDLLINAKLNVVIESLTPEAHSTISDYESLIYAKSRAPRVTFTDDRQDLSVNSAHVTVYENDRWKVHVDLQDHLNEELFIKFEASKQQAEQTLEKCETALALGNLKIKQQNKLKRNIHSAKQQITRVERSRHLAQSILDKHR